MKKLVYRHILQTFVILNLLAVWAFGQSFVVKPMKVALESEPGARAEQVLELKNFDEEKTRELELHLVELTQGKNGKLEVIEQNAGTGAGPFSCLGWTSISTDSVAIPPLSTAKPAVIVEAPMRSRGFYCAGLVVQSKPDRSSNGLALVVRFVVPILVNIAGKPVLQKVELTDVGLAFRESTEKLPAETLATLEVSNSGKSFSRIKANLKIMRDVDGHWMNVTTVDFKKSAIIPGLKIAYDCPTQRNLPSGKYKLEGILYLDGRRTRPFTREIYYNGDPTVTKVVCDTSLLLDPTYVSIQALPGSTRTAILAVENGSTETVNIVAEPQITPGLKGVSLGELTGDDLMCHDWVKIVPDKFTLRGGARQNIRVMAQVPRFERMNPSYYANLNLKAQYNDGQSAGKIDTLICIENSKSRPKPLAQVINCDLVAERDSLYVIRARVGNVGETHFVPSCEVVVAKPSGTRIIHAPLSGPQGLMLPLEMRDYSGAVDFAEINEGVYTMRIQLQCGSAGTLTKEIPVKVSHEGDSKLVEIVKG